MTITTPEGPGIGVPSIQIGSFALQSLAFIVDAIDMTKSKLSKAAASVVAIVLFTGCANDAGNGALIGGGVGALAGGIIGHQTGHAFGGALIGGAVGAGTGALIGHASDEHKIDEQKKYDQGYSDAQRASYRPAPSSGYYSSSETSRSGIGNGGYSSSRTSTVTTSETYAR